MNVTNYLFIYWGLQKDIGHGDGIGFYQKQIHIVRATTKSNRYWHRSDLLFQFATIHPIFIDDHDILAIRKKNHSTAVYWYDYCIYRKLSDCFVESIWLDFYVLHLKHVPLSKTTLLLFRVLRCFPPGALEVLLIISISFFLVYMYGIKRGHELVGKTK